MLNHLHHSGHFIVALWRSLRRTLNSLMDKRRVRVFDRDQKPVKRATRHIDPIFSEMNQSAHGVCDALGLQGHAQLKMRKTNAQGLNQVSETSETFPGFPPGPFPEHGRQVNAGLGIGREHGPVVVKHENRIEAHLKFPGK